MRILSIDKDPLWSFHTKRVSSTGKSCGQMLPIYNATVDVLPTGIEGIVCTSDLQGHVPAPSNKGPILIGAHLPSLLKEQAASGLLPPLDRMGAILAGDLFSHGHKRGGYGNTRPVWENGVSIFAG